MTAKHSHTSYNSTPLLDEEFDIVEAAKDYMQQPDEDISATDEELWLERICMPRAA